MAVSERGTDVEFLHTLIKGPALKSYGIYVAELAGLPSAVTRRAKSLLKQVESQKVNVSAQLSFMDYMIEEPEPVSAVEDSLSQSERQVCSKIRELSLSDLTPLKALNALAEWQETLKSLN
jgi:DNA mismatch repair protein MutS